MSDNAPQRVWIVVLMLKGGDLDLHVYESEDDARNHAKSIIDNSAIPVAVVPSNVIKAS